jgi:hypothetical protein
MNINVARMETPAIAPITAPAIVPGLVAPDAASLPLGAEAEGVTSCGDWVCVEDAGSVELEELQCWISENGLHGRHGKDAL